MRMAIRGVTTAALALLLALAACERRGPAEGEATQPPTDAEREAAVAAEQLAALGGPASAAQRALYEGDFEASGGLDPGAGGGAWVLTLLDEYAQFSQPGLGDEPGFPGERDYHERGMRVVAGSLTITIMHGACTASGVELPYTAYVLFQGVVYQGCARRGVSERARASWSDQLPELIPAIDACLARAASRPARVTFAAALDDADVAVRMREADGARRECIVNVAGGAPTVYETLSDVDRRPSESDPEFARGGAQPRQCAQAATGRDGARLGWLIPRGC